MRPAGSGAIAVRGRRYLPEGPLGGNAGSAEKEEVKVNLRTYQIKAEENGTLTITGQPEQPGHWRLSHVVPHVQNTPIEYHGVRVGRQDDSHLQVEYDSSDGVVTLEVRKLDDRTASFRMKVRDLPADAAWATAGPFAARHARGFDAAYRCGRFGWEPSLVHPLGGSARWRSDYVLGLSGRRSVALGFVTHRNTFNYFEYEAAQNAPLSSVKAICECGGVQLGRRSTESIWSEELILTESASLEDALSHWAEVTAERMGARAWPGSLSGWDSWYSDYQHVTHEKCISELKGMQGRADRARLDYFIVGMGYNRNLGDWLLPSPGYGPPVAQTLEAARDAGFRPGLWLAPFAVGNRSELFREHPDWVRRGVDGSPMPVCKSYGEPTLWFGNREIYAADPTHPEFLDYLSRTVRLMREEWGVELLKLDFLHYACIPGGTLFDRSKTPAQAYRNALQVIRDAFGDGFLLAASAPLCPSIGLVDGCRINSEIGPDWKNWYSSSTAMETALSRAFMHRRFWLNDAGPVFLRDSFTDLDAQETRTRALIQCMTGGIFLTGDSIGRLSADRLELLRFLLPIHGSGSEALNLAEYRSGVLRKSTVIDHNLLVAVGLMNISNDDRAFEVDLESHGPHGAAHVYDAWRQQYLGRKTGRMKVALAAHESVLYFLTEARDHEMQVICSSSHVSGAEDIASIAPEENALQLAPLRAPCRAVVYAPDGLQAAGATLRDLGDGAYEVQFDQRVTLRATAGVVP